MEMIYYELQSSTAVLAVYCNFCGKRCSFCYSWPHYDIAFWTHKKESIMCPKCARNNKEKIYRKVHSERDIPLHRSRFRSTCSENIQMFSNHTENIKSYPYKFCSEEEEEKELNSTKKIDPKCDCRECNK